jgi:hypothetical protein
LRIADLCVVPRLKLLQIQSAVRNPKSEVAISDVTKIAVTSCSRYLH